VPYRVYGGLRFFERAEVKHALAYLRLLENSDDDSAFLRVVNLPARGIGARTLELLQDQAAAQGISLYRAVPLVQGGASARLGQFVALIERLRMQAQGLPLTEAIDHVIGASGLITFYQGEREGQDRIENLKELVNAAAAFLAEMGIDRHVPASVGLAQAAADATATAPEVPQVVEFSDVEGAPPAPGMTQVALSPLAGFLAHASLESGERQAGEGSDAIQMMTVHAAKGLEFDSVFVTGLEEGLFPHDNSSTQADGLEEERRLMYVAITRARERLYLSFSQTRQLHGQTRYNVRSRFIGELPEQDLKWLTARNGAGGSSGYGTRGAYGGQAGFGNFGGSGRGSAYPARAVATRATSFAGAGGWREGEGAAHRSSPRDARFRIGQGVAHPRFGEGVVTGIEGAGDDARVQVNFARHGSKWLALSIAKLDPV
jgi:DNA helicase-2/ATP-dependent DNA helicase PcrA